MNAVLAGFLLCLARGLCLLLFGLISEKVFDEFFLGLARVALKVAAYGGLYRRSGEALQPELRQGFGGQCCVAAQFVVDSGDAPVG